LEIGHASEDQNEFAMMEGTPGSFELDIFNTVLMRKTIRGSIVGTRLDLAECLQFAGDGKVKVHYSVEPLENINDIFNRMRANKLDGRVVMKI
jgi:propanol-preferring alcohol dehydrogenase